ncbi:MAG: hypothetical protein JWR69_2219 [Pedosphaera sp.]|nr:hypothetical protein [Pedosphaera sp.]
MIDSTSIPPVRQGTPAWTRVICPQGPEVREWVRPATWPSGTTIVRLDDATLPLATKEPTRPLQHSSISLATRCRGDSTRCQKNLTKALLPHKTTKENNRKTKSNMKLPIHGKKFTPCPEYKGKAVCVDVTPLRLYETKDGPREKFKFVFEVDLERPDGGRHAVWSMPMTLSNHENSNLMKFMKEWTGQALTREEQELLDTEDLIGRPAEMVVINDFKNGVTYANIKLIMPDKSGNPLKPSSKFVRTKDRQAGVVSASSTGGHQVPHRAVGIVDHGMVRVHTGRHKGQELRELSTEAVQGLVEHWLPIAAANDRPTDEDKRLVAALEWWQSKQIKEQENCPY